MQASYLRTRAGDFVVLTTDNAVATIPPDPANSDYAALLRLQEEGKIVIAPAGA